MCVAQVFRRAAASVVTLGSGASLGPEAPSVELGANTAAVLAPKHLSKRRQRMLVAAGAAAGGSGYRPVACTSQHRAALHGPLIYYGVMLSCPQAAQAGCHQQMTCQAVPDL